MMTSIQSNLSIVIPFLSNLHQLINRSLHLINLVTSSNIKKEVMMELAVLAKTLFISNNNSISFCMTSKILRLLKVLFLSAQVAIINSRERFLRINTILTNRELESHLKDKTLEVKVKRTFISHRIPHRMFRFDK